MYISLVQQIRSVVLNVMDTEKSIVGGRHLVMPQSAWPFMKMRLHHGRKKCRMERSNDSNNAEKFELSNCNKPIDWIRRTHTNYFGRELNIYKW